MTNALSKHLTLVTICMLHTCWGMSGFVLYHILFPSIYCLRSWVIRHMPQEWEMQRSIILWSGQYQCLQIDTLVATLPGTWQDRVRARTVWVCVSTLRLAEIASLTCNFCLCVAACITVYGDPSLWYTGMLLGCSATIQQTTSTASLSKV